MKMFFYNTKDFFFATMKKCFRDESINQNKRTHYHPKMKVAY